MLNPTRYDAQDFDDGDDYDAITRRRYGLSKDDPVYTFNTAAPWSDACLSDLPPRQWLYGRHYLRGALSLTIADGGVGKTSLALTEAVAMASGKPILGIPVQQRSVWYWNGEEDFLEIQRRVFAICERFEVNRKISGYGYRQRLAISNHSR